MRLVWATEDLRIGRLSFEGFPLFLDRNGDPVEDVFSFLVHQLLHRGAVESRKTWQAYGYAFKDFLTFLESERHATWNEPRQVGRPSVLARYRLWAHKVRRQQPDTINTRLDKLVAFYSFAVRHNWIDEAPFGLEERALLRRGRNQMPGGRHSKAVADVKFRTRRRAVKVLSADDAGAFLGALTRVHRLMAKFQLSTGLRVDELVSFPASYVVDPRRFPNVKHFFPVLLSPNDMRIKGSVERTIHVPRDVMAQLWAYWSMERSRRARWSSTKSNVLFLTKDGNPYTGKAVWRIYADTKKQTKLHVNPHLLRHTYATHTLAALAKSFNIGNALLYVRNRLGHSSIKSTQVYLHYIDDIAESIMAIYQNELTAQISQEDFTVER